MSKLLLFEKLHNTRDLGGMKTADGRTVQAGRLFRSGHLSDLTAADADVLSELIDTRSDSDFPCFFICQHAACICLMHW